MTILWLLLITALAQVRAPAPGANATRASVEGIVVRADVTPAAPNWKLANVLVELNPGRYSTLSRGDGSFSFRNLTPGRYLISVSREGFVPQEDARRGLTLSGLPVTLIAGQSLKDVVLPMAPAPFIAGQVFNPYGDPVAAGLLLAYRNRYTPDGLQLKIVRRTMTNDLGQFRLFWLNYGEYLVSAAYNDRDRASALGNVRLSPNVSKPDDGYATAFYGTNSNVADARSVQLAPGMDAGSLTINLTDVSRARFKVRGRVVPPAPGMSLQFVPQGGDLDGSNGSAGASANGQFEIRGVSPGSYVLLATAERMSSDVMTISVGDGDVDGVIVPMSPTLDVGGRILSDGRAALTGRGLTGRGVPNFGGLRVVATRSSTEVDQKIKTITNSNGLFTLQQVGPGNYDISVEVLPPDMYIRSMTLAGRNVLSGKATFMAFQQLQIVLATAAAGVEGVVRRRGDAAGSTQIVLVPEPMLRRRTDRYITGYSDNEGKFQLNAIPPGRYTAYAFERIEPGAYYAFAYSTDVNNRFADRGVPVTVGEGGTSAIELNVIPAAETAGGLR